MVKTKARKQKTKKPKPFDLDNQMGIHGCHKKEKQ